MKPKTFDCVEMMNRGAEEVRKKIRSMTKKEEIAFWRERSQKLRQRQSNVQREGEREPSVR